jgi:hypothetical protein
MNDEEIQALIDATPEGGVITLPAGVHIIGRPLRMKKGQTWNIVPDKKDGV